MALADGDLGALCPATNGDDQLFPVPSRLTPAFSRTSATLLKMLMAVISSVYRLAHCSSPFGWGKQGDQHQRLEKMGVLLNHQARTDDAGCDRRGKLAVGFVLLTPNPILKQYLLNTIN
jgi:hypothetical protein